MALGVMDIKDQPLDSERRSSVSQVSVETLGYRTFEKYDSN